MSSQNVIILTGAELRHQYFYLKLQQDSRFNVVLTVCEGLEKSLQAYVQGKDESSALEHLHVQARTQSEEDFFGEFVKLAEPKGAVLAIPKGEINSQHVTDEILAHNPDLIICYGSSIIRSSLLTSYAGRFVNVHLGLSPYYRGSGTNVWPLINGEPELVGVTFMHIDEGIDTGKVIHQIRADLWLGDSPHTIGNRLIRKMTDTAGDLLANFNRLKDEEQIEAEGLYYKQKDFDAVACKKLYQSLADLKLYERQVELESTDLRSIVENSGMK